MVVLYRKYESRNTHFEGEDLRYAINVVFMNFKYFSSVLCWLTLQSCFGIKNSRRHFCPFVWLKKKSNVEDVYTADCRQDDMCEH